MPLVGFEPTISAGEWPQTYALDRVDIGTGRDEGYATIFYWNVCTKTLSCKQQQDSIWAVSSSSSQSPRNTECRKFCRMELHENSYNVKVILYGKMVTAQLEIMIPHFLSASNDNENSLR